MPTYEYYCPKCQKVKEIVHKISDPDQTICPDCLSPGLVKQIPRVGLQFKGSGFYATDYQKGSSCCNSSCSCAKKKNKTN